MSATEPATFERVTCPSCRAALKLRSELVGQRVKCHCGELFLAPTSEEIAEITRKVAADRALALRYAPAHKRVVTPDENPPPEANALLDLHLPLVLLPLGVVLSLVQATYFDKHDHALSDVLGMTILTMLASVALMIVAVLGATLALGMAFDTRPWQTALKIAPIAMIPSPAGAIIGHAIGGMNGDILGVLSAVAIYTALVKLILRQPWENTGVIVFACWTIRALTMYAIFKCQGAASGSPV